MTDAAVLLTTPAGYQLGSSGAPGIIGEPVNGILNMAPFAAYIGVAR